MGSLSLQLPPTAMENFECYGRPQYDRQRSYSAPEFRVIDVTATEAVMICSAAAKASDRRRGRRDRRHASLDANAERSFSRDADRSREAFQMEIPIIEEPEEDQLTPTNDNLSNYAQNMAMLMQQKINAIQYGAFTSLADVNPFSPRAVPDNQLCPSPPTSEYEEDEVMEIDPLHSVNGTLLRPPLRSAFSAWSSAETTPITPEPPHFDSQDNLQEPTNYFNFPEPPKMRVDSVTSTIYQPVYSSSQADDDNCPPISHPAPRKPVSDHVFLTNYSLDKPSSSNFSTPVYNCGQHFPSRKTVPPTSYQGESMSRVHRVF